MRSCYLFAICSQLAHCAIIAEAVPWSIELQPYAASFVGAYILVDLLICGCFSANHFPSDHEGSGWFSAINSAFLYLGGIVFGPLAAGYPGTGTANSSIL